MSWIYVWTSKIKNIYVWTTSVKEVYVWTTKVRPSWWQPWANTIAYYPFKSDMLDYSWNNNHWTSWTWTFANNMITTTSNLTRDTLVSNRSMNFTLTAWVDVSKTSSNAWYAMIAPHANTDWPSMWIWVNRNDGYIAWALTNTWVIPASQSLSGIHCIHLTRDSSTFKVYVDWVLKWTSSNGQSLRAASIARIWWTNYSSFYSITCWNVIFENKAWTQTEITDYYNLTKWDYWL